MKTPPPILETIRVRNFKAIRDTGTLTLTPLTVFIGNNGSGKSSIIEALETYHLFLTQGLDEAFARWRGIEFVRNQAVDRRATYSKKTGRDRAGNPVELQLTGNTGLKRFSTKTVLNDENNDNYLLIQEETGRIGNMLIDRDEGGTLSIDDKISGILPGTRSAFVGERFYAMSYVGKWQFLNFSPSVMGEPHPRSRVRANVRLTSTGSNLGEYLMDLRRRDLEAFDSILQTLRRIIGYSDDLQPVMATELERSVYLQMSERGFKVPGWLLSSGTLRILGLLAVFRDPTPAPLVLIEELENGLDPRSVRIILQEIQQTVESGRSQVIFTTHSPYLLDLLRLSDIVLTERDEHGEPRFFRPSKEKEARLWAEKFDPGRLYVKGHLNRRGPNP